ncbi:MAG: LD-carboxypeptidase [Acidobacteria bacterium]|nr:LD-carboxypeptidase [Acidobacteriota bacterium]
MIAPRALAPGARIAIVSTASVCSRDEFDLGVAELRRLGYEPTYGESAFEKSMFTAGTAAVRAEAFKRAWDDPSIAAIIATRGGYGSVQILPELDGWFPQRAPKLFIGYSDNTSLLTWLTCQCGIAALHGPMIDGRLSKGPDGYDQRSFLSLLQGRGDGLELRPGGLSVLQSGEVSGPLYGGTLTQLVASLGTPYAFDPPEGCILFIEDVNERPYRIDRMLTQLLLAGVLRRARGLVFGEMRGCDEPGGNPTAADAIRAFTTDFPGPVLFGFPSGHTAGPCWTLPFGVRVFVNTDQGLIRIEESPVA